MHAPGELKLQIFLVDLSSLRYISHMYTLILMCTPTLLGAIFFFVTTSKWYRSKGHPSGPSGLLTAITVLFVMSSSVWVAIFSVDKAKETAKERLLFVTQVNRVKMKFNLSGQIDFCGKYPEENMYQCVTRLEGSDGLSTTNSLAPVEFIEVRPDPNWALFEKEVYTVARVQK